MADDNKIQVPNKVLFAVSPVAQDIMEKGGYVPLSGGNPFEYALKLSAGTANVEKKVPRLAFTENPMQNDHYAGVFKIKRYLLPDDVIKRIRVQCHLIAAILRGRSNMLSMFARVRKDRFDIGMEINVKDEFHASLCEEDMAMVKNRMAKALNMIINCGSNSGLKNNEKMLFSEFLSIQVYNGLSFGRHATEMIYDSDPHSNIRTFNRFRPVDAGTIRIAYKRGEYAEPLRLQSIAMLEQITGDRVDKGLLKLDKLRAGDVAYVQEVQGMPRQAFTHDEMIVKNMYPQTDVEHNGYPPTPMDTVIASIATHISIEEYNKLYFQNGRAAKGMLVIQSDDVDQAVLDNVKAEFSASINNVSNSFRVPVFGVAQKDTVQWVPMTAAKKDGEFEFLYDQVSRNILSAFNMSPDELPGYSHLCLNSSTYVWTDKGFSTIGEILGDKDVVENLNVWNGKEFIKARAFVTGDRPVCHTKTNNGLTISTSPEHRFRTVNNKGELVWTEQKNLQIGDTVLINKKPIPGLEELVPNYKGTRLSLDMMEILGWLTGDGSIFVRKKGKIRHSKELCFYYHHDKEVWIRERHNKILTDFGLKPINTDRQISLVARERQKERFGFKEVSSVKKSMSLYNTEFVEWLLELGFKPSTDRKNIPNFIHSLPIEYRCSFLKGFFSADGSKDKLNTPNISIIDNLTRNETKQLLLGLGIRTRNCEGTTRLHIRKQEGHIEAIKEFVDEPSRLIIKDKEEFYEKIGFLQPHKQPMEGFLDNSEFKWNKVPRSVSIAFADKLLSNPFLSAEEKREIRSSLKKVEFDRALTSTLNRYSKKYNMDLPSWINDFHQEEVISLERTDEIIEMVDIELFDNDHAFIADGIIVHNSGATNSQALSSSSNEYKLTAARDMGLRPIIMHFEDFINSELLPVIDPELAPLVYISLAGLDAETRDQEFNKLERGAPLYMNFDEILRDVDKEPLGKALLGTLPMNDKWQISIDKYMNVGDVISQFTDDPTHMFDSMLKFKRDAFYINNLQAMMQINPIAVKAYYARNPMDFSIMTDLLQDMIDEESQE